MTSRGGRPSKLTPERKERFLKALRTGAHIETAANAAGVDYSTIRNWMSRGEAQKSGEYFSFFEDAIKAIADAEMSLVSRVNTAATDDWRAASWILERRHPDRWANTQRVKVEVEKELEQTLEKLEKSLPSAIFEQVLRAIADDPVSSETTTQDQS